MFTTIDLNKKSKIRQIREKLKLSQVKFGKAIGITGKSFAQI